MKKAMIVAALLFVVMGIGAFAQDGPDRTRLVPVNLNSENYRGVGSDGNPTVVEKEEWVFFMPTGDSFKRTIYKVVPIVKKWVPQPDKLETTDGTPFFVVKEEGKETIIPQKVDKKPDVFVKVQEDTKTNTVVEKKPIWRYQVKY